MPEKPQTSMPTSQLHILLALADGPKHGYAVMREIEGMTDGKTAMGPGMVYGTIKRLLELGLIEETDEHVDPEVDDSRRRYYRITQAGFAALSAETERLAQLVRAAQGKRSTSFDPQLGGA